MGKTFEKGIFRKINIMRVGFSRNIDLLDAPSGKHKFFIRLAREMRSVGIKIDNKKPHVYIYLVSDKIYKKAKVNVLRLDGLIMNTRWNYREKNKEILKSIKRSDALIYQGKFCKDAYKYFLKITKTPDVIIPNGASPKEFLPRRPKNYFLANCKWRPHKRLKSTIESFLLALDMGLDSDLVITGKPDYKVKHPRIKYLKWVKDNKVKELLSGAIASLHLTWLDWCPNSMVEAIVAGCPVIYTESGGQTELGRESGIRVKDKRWNFKLIDLYAPPNIDIRFVANSMIYLKKNKKELYPVREDLNIKNVCKNYLNYFEKLLK